MFVKAQILDRKGWVSFGICSDSYAIERFVNFATCELSLQEFGKLCLKDQSVVRSQKGYIGFP